MGSVSSIPRPLKPEAFKDAAQRGGEAEPSMFNEIHDPELRTAVKAAYKAWARNYPHLVEDWPA